MTQDELCGRLSELQTCILALEDEAAKGRQCMRNARLVTEFDRAEGITEALGLALSIVRARLFWVHARGEATCPECGNRPITAPPATGCKNGLHLQADSLRRLDETRAGKAVTTR
jgi:hypothetical protein